MRQNASECVKNASWMRQNASNHAAVHSHVVSQNWYAMVHLGPHPVILRVFA
jgi:hypothetical protein